MKKRLHLIMLILLVLLTSVACSDSSDSDSTPKETETSTTIESQDETTTVSKDNFTTQAISAVLESQHVKDNVTTYGLSSVSVDITDNRINGYSADIKCVVTYSNGYSEITEKLQCAMEEWSAGWKVESVEVESLSKCTPTKFPDKVLFEKVTTSDNTIWAITATGVALTGNVDTIVEIVESYPITKVSWTTSDVSSDLTKGLVTIDITCKDEKDNGSISGKLNFDSSICKWILTIDRKVGDIVGKLPRPVLDDYGSGEILIYAPQEDYNYGITEKYAKNFISSNPKYSGYTINVEYLSPNDSYSIIAHDSAYFKADVFNYGSGYHLHVAADNNFLYDLSGTYYEQYVAKNNDESAVKGAQVNEHTYAFPSSSDNGYFLFYDKSVITDPTSLEAIIRDCEAAGKKFCFNLSNSWYLPSFFYATGCELSYDSLNGYDITNANIDIDSEKGLIALKEILALASSPAFVDTSSFNCDNIGAIVTGTWDASDAQNTFGSNYAAGKLPEFIGSDGNTYQLSSFAGHKYWCVRPQSNEGKVALCLNLAEYLSSTEVQLAYFEAFGRIPSNIQAQEHNLVKSDIAVSALIAQQKHSVVQGVMSNSYWNVATEFGMQIVDGVLSTSTPDNYLMEKLKEFADDIKVY